ncbi:MAG: arylsulfatase A-like enzyme [Myxococcota bacterium]|jgi:arylsulfatase A-like enzyme
MWGWLAVGVMMAGTAVAQEAEPPQLNVMLITVDNLRPANMGVYGYERDTTPFLSSVADRSLIFENAWSTSAWTSPGMNSFFTGYWPPTHGQNGHFDWWDPTLPSAVKLFIDAGYRTAGYSNRGPTYANIGWQYETNPYADELDVIDNRALPSLINKPFFAWMHFKDVHLPYNKGDSYHRRLWGAAGEPTVAVQTVLDNVTIYRGQQDFEFTEDDQQVVRGLYDSAVAHADARIGAMYEKLNATGLLDRTILIISADHGEEQFEHGWLGHASTSWDGKLFDESWHIPFIVIVPDAAMTGRIDAPVQQLDLMPTLTELLNIPTDDLVLPMQGVSLLPLMRGETTEGPRPYSFAQTTYKGWATPLDEMRARVTAVRSDSLKLMRWGRADGDELVGYDLVADPDEQAPIDAMTDDRFAPLHQAMLEWDAETQQGAATLAMAAAEGEIERQREADGDVRQIMQAYSDLLLVEQTFANEVFPFTEEERWARQWSRLMERSRKNAARAVGRP